LMVGVSHTEAAPEQLAALGHSVPFIEARLRETDLTGFVTLATCNRFEIYAEAPTFHGAISTILDVIDAACPDVALDLNASFYTAHGQAMTEHLFRVTAGLESMVVGECEIVGQVRRALLESSEHCSAALHRLFDAALTCSKTISSQTGLREVGRNLASVGLDLAAPHLDDWASTRALVLGTGQYAGTVVAELKRRGCVAIRVYSASGNGGAFADSHGVKIAPQLSAAMNGSDVLIAASGTGPAKADTASVALTPIKAIVDLTGGADLTQGSEADSAVPIIGLNAIGEASPPACRESEATAEHLIEEAIATYCHHEDGRDAGQSVSAIRGMMNAAIEAELDRVRRTHSAEVMQAVEKSLRRVAAHLSHQPSVAAADLARIGRLGEYNQALEMLFGIRVNAEATR
jgi:glutamyl-tRNA reductase